MLGCSQLSRAPGCRVAWGGWGYNPQESQRQVQNPAPGVDFFLSCNFKKKTRIAKLGRRILNSNLFVPDGFRGCADFFLMHNPPHHVRKPRWLRQGNAATFLTISNQNNSIFFSCQFFQSKNSCRDTPCAQAVAWAFSKGGEAAAGPWLVHLPSARSLSPRGCLPTVPVHLCMSSFLKYSTPSQWVLLGPTSASSTLLCLRAPAISCCEVSKRTRTCANCVAGREDGEWEMGVFENV